MSVTITNIPGDQVLSTSRGVINSNFTNLKVAVESNQASISTLQTDVSDLQTDVGDIPALIAADLAAFTGSSAVVTLGTVSTGTWSATTIAVAKGGTGLTTTPANGKLLIGNGSGYSLANITAGTNITITNSAGGIKIDATGGGGGGGTVTDVSVATANGVSGTVANSTTTPDITIILGDITPSKVNSVVISGSATPTLAVTGTTTVSGANTGDQTNITGNAATATKLATARAINGVNFDGTAPITITAAAGTLTGGTLNSGVTASSLTSVGTLANLTVTNPIVADVTGNAATATLASAASVLSPGRTINGTAFDGSSNITITAAAGTLTGSTLNATVVTSSLTSVGTLANLTVTNPITGAVSGNAGTATKLATGRTIAVTGDLAYTSPSFDGSGNVTAAGTLATVNSNVGSFTSANITVNAKGLITAASNGSGGGSGDIVATLVNSEVSITTGTTLTSGAFSKMHVCSGTSADYTVILPAVSGNAGKIIGFRMDPGLTKLVTVDGNSTELIDGRQTRVMWTNEVAILLCDGTEWIKIAGKSIPMRAQMSLSVYQSPVVSGVATKVLLDTFAYDTTSMADTTNSKIICRRPSYYDVQAQIAYSVDSAPTPMISGAITLAAAYTNGASSVFSAYSLPAISFPEPKGITTIRLAAADYIELNGSQYTGADATFMPFPTGNTVLTVSEQITW